MPLNRFIHADTFTSEDFTALSLEARLLWIGLFGCVADDEGRGKASPAFLNVKVFPADGFTPAQVGGWLGEIQARGMVTLYSSEGCRLFEIPSWATWQRPKYVKPSKFKSSKDLANPAGNRPRVGKGRVGKGRVGHNNPLTPTSGGPDNNRREEGNNPRARGSSPRQKGESSRQLRKLTRDEFGHILWCPHQAIGAEPDPDNCPFCEARAEEEQP